MTPNPTLNLTLNFTLNQTLGQGSAQKKFVRNPEPTGTHLFGFRPGTRNPLENSGDKTAS